MTEPIKDFTPIRDDYEFFFSHATEADADLDGYSERMRSFDAPAEAIRMLDFGCGPGAFTGRFLERAGWEPGRLDLTLVEPSAVYRQAAVERLGALTDRPIRAWGDLPSGPTDVFDLILANHVFYYVPDLEAVLGRIVSALAPGGLFLTTVAGRENVLIDLWFQGFSWLGQPVPYKTAEDLEAVLTRLGRTFDRTDVRYDLNFPDCEENRLRMLRFTFGEHLASLPRDEALGLFTPFAVGSRIEIHTVDRQYLVRGLRRDETG